MRYKKIMIIMLILTCLLVVSAVSAAENATDDIIGADVASDVAMTSEDAGLGLSADNQMEYNLQTNEENHTLAVGDDETVSAETDSEILTEDQYSYSYLREQIGSGGNKNLTKGTYTYNQNDGDTIQITDSGVIDGNGAIIDMAGSSIRAFEVTRSGVTIKNLTIKNAKFNDGGGAIYFNGSGVVINCNFVNNAVNSKNRGGGAVYFYGNGTVTNCNFTNNTARAGGAVYFNEIGITKNSNFTDNSAYSWGGGAIWMYSGSVENCNFTANKGNSSWSSGGAVYFGYFPDSDSYVYDNCTVTNCNFTNNNAWEGGAIAIYYGSIENCSFTENKATGDGAWGGAVYFGKMGTVKNCNFTDNSAHDEGGAIVMNCGSVENCNFMGNNASVGSAIYFNNAGIWKKIFVNDSGDSYWDYVVIYPSSNVSNSRFLNNRANAEDLQITKNDNNITIIFTGKDSLLNAIYSKRDVEVTFTNVTYWAANGIATTGSSTISPSMSNRAAGQNITIFIIVNDAVVLNDVKLTDEDGMIVLNISAGEKYFIAAFHNSDSYYTEAEKTISKNTKFNVNVTSQTTNNKTVNITAKSNIYNEFMPGKLLFVLQNTENITANYAGNGTWWAVHTFDDYAAYDVTAKYGELDNIEINDATITITKANSTLTVEDIAFDYKGYGSAVVSFTGATGVNANVINKSNAKVNVNGNTITVSGLNVGTYYLKVTTIADDDHNNVAKIVTITVNKLKTELVASAVTATYNINKNLVITLRDAKGNPLRGVKITVGINGGIFTTDNNGKVRVNVALLAPKTYSVKLTFNGNDNYVKSTKNVKVTVRKATPKLITSKKIFKTSLKVKNYIVTLKTNQNRAMKSVWVTLNVNKKLYKVKTNAKGQAIFKINNLAKKGNYKVVVKFAGNKYYNARTVNTYISCR